MTPFILYNIFTTILYIILFIVSLILASRRSERGFYLIPVASGLWLLNVAMTWTQSTTLHKLTFVLFPLGVIALIIGVVLLMVDSRK